MNPETARNVLSGAGNAPLPNPLGISPRAGRILLALLALPPVVYGAHQGYQALKRPPGPPGEPEKQAALRRYGLPVSLAGRIFGA